MHGPPGHQCSHGSQNRKRLGWAFALSSVYMLAEFIGGWMTNSLALLADAGHMLSDVAALGLSFFAIWIAGRPSPSHRTYGYYRAEILAALVNGASLIAIALMIFWEAIQRFQTPEEVMGRINEVGGNVEEVFDLNQETFNELISEMDLVYLPGCSAPKGAEAEEFKQMMDDYFVRFETLDQVYKETGRIIRVTHTLPRRAGEMDLRIDTTPSQQYFEAIAYSVSIRMALVASILGD